MDSRLRLALLPLALSFATSLAACGDNGLPTADGGGDAASNDGAADDLGMVCQSPTGTLCGTDCVDVTTDPSNCGSCGTVCDAGHVCRAGECVILCPAGEMGCHGTCVNLQTDSQHCGSCDQGACPVGYLCSTGKCVLTCQQGLTVCNSGCVDLMSDNAHCGDCNTACPSGNLCSAGACSLSCQKGLTNCGGVCTNLASDVGHCGACDNSACPAGNVCTSGKCVLTCQEGLSNCGGTCVDLSSSDAHCGGCQTVCSAGHVCQAGQCVLTCQTGLVACGDTCTNTQSDPLHCGDCSTTCAAGRVCSSGKCSVTCAAGQTECSGACTNLMSDNLHCGDCATACDAGSACESGVCVATCVKPSQVCGNACVDTRYDPANCGGCGVACPSVPNGAPGCASGTCGIASCTGLFRDCNSTASDGCETDTSSDYKNCGACNNVCLSGVCQNGKCGGSCNGTVLIVADDQRLTSDVLLQKQLETGGLGVTITSVDIASYTGSPDPAKFGAVVVLVGNDYNADMPAQGQQAIVDAAAAGTGVVFSEWMGYEVANGRMKLLAPLTLLRTGANLQQNLSFTVDSGFANHPIWSGLGQSFKLVNVMGANFSNNVVNGGQRIAGVVGGGNVQGAGVVVRDESGQAGRVVEMAFAADCGGQCNGAWCPWENDAKLDQLVTNAVLWAAKCK